MTPLPRLMVAPNGARLGKADHPAIPLSMDEIVATAQSCHRAGADGLHLHLRDADGKHVLDSGLYAEALTELRRAVPGMAVQITTEAVGLYTSDQQRKVALGSGAKLVSTSIREIMTDTSPRDAQAFFQAASDAEITIQFILYDRNDAELLRSVLPRHMFASSSLQVLFVLGRYSTNRDSSPADLIPFLDWKAQAGWTPDWAVCAFGPGETACLQRTFEERGKLRVGFENSIWSADGTVAHDNAQRVGEIAAFMRVPGTA